jgi:hypothetical protein
MSKFPTGAATPASIIDTLKAVAGDPPKVRASFAKGRMRSRHLCHVGSGAGDYKIPQLHKIITRAGALLGGRRRS